MDTGVTIFPTHDAIARADVARLAEEGGRAVHWLPSAPRGPVGRALDRYEAAVAEFCLATDLLRQGVAVLDRADRMATSSGCSSPGAAASSSTSGYG